MKAWRGAALAAVTAALLAACGSSSGSSGPSAEQQVCSAKSALSASVQKVADDLKSLNLGQAKTDWATVKTDAAALGTAVASLQSEKKAELQPQVDALKATLGTLTDSPNLQELGATLDTAKQQVTQIVDTAGRTAGCSSASSAT